MDSQYAQPTFYDEAVDPTDLFPAAQSLGGDCLSDDIASYFSFDDTSLHGSGATTPNYYPPSSQHDGSDEVSQADDMDDSSTGGRDEEQQAREVKVAVAVAVATVDKVEYSRDRADSGVKKSNSGSKPKRKYSASVTEEMAEVAVVVAAAPAVSAAPVAAETKASKRAKKLAQINVAAAVSSPSPLSPFSLSPSFSSGSVSPAPSFSSASTPSPTHSSSSPPLAAGDVDVGALLAESALKKSRLARKAELARLGRKRKNETIEKYSQQVDRLQAEMRQLKQQMDKERKAHKRAMKLAMEADKAARVSETDEVMVKVEAAPSDASAAPVAAAVAVKQPTEEVLAASQSTLIALATFCKQRDVDTATTTAACSALLTHMHSIAATHTAVDGYRMALQRAAVEVDTVAALVARFFASYSLQCAGSAGSVSVSGGGGVMSGDVKPVAVWESMWQQPRGQVTEQQLDELNVWMKTAMV